MDTRPEWVKEKVESFTFYTRKDIVKEVELDFRMESSKNVKFKEGKMKMRDYLKVMKPSRQHKPTICPGVSKKCHNQMERGNRGRIKQEEPF